MSLAKVGVPVQALPIHAPTGNLVTTVRSSGFRNDARQESLAKVGGPMGESSSTNRLSNDGLCQVSLAKVGVPERPQSSRARGDARQESLAKVGGPAKSSFSSIRPTGISQVSLAKVGVPVQDPIPFGSSMLLPRLGDVRPLQESLAKVADPASQHGASASQVGLS